MPAWSFGSLRPKLDRFFEGVRHALEARSDSGVDRHRLEDFLNQSNDLQVRLYTCLKSDDRSDLAAILKEIQVLAYRTRVLFGSPLPGVAWDDVHSLLLAVPPSAAPASRVLEGAMHATLTSKDLTNARRESRLPDRTLASPSPAVRDSVLASREVSVILDPVSLEPPAMPANSLEVPADMATLTPPPAPHAAETRVEGTLPAPEPEFPGEPAEALPADAVTPGWTLPRWPALLGVLIFLLGAIAGSTLGGIHPFLTAVACGLLAIAATRP